MGLFTQYHHLYKEPERLTKDEARERRFAALLQEERRKLEVRTDPLSPANRFHLNRLKEFQVKFTDELEARRKRAEELHRANQRNPSIQRSLAAKAAISRFFQLHQRQQTLLQRAAAERRARIYGAASAFDGRFFNFGVVTPKTVFGTNAWLKLHGADAVTARVYKNPLLSLPCVQRMVRREVMFARKQAGRGHKVPHRKGPFTDIWC